MPRKKTAEIEEDTILANGIEVAEKIPYRTQVRFPFIPEVRSYDESIQRELDMRIAEISAFHKIPAKELSASIHLTFLGDVWHLSGEVIHGTTN